MTLVVTVVSAKNLPNLEVVGKIDPIATINYQGNDEKDNLFHLFLYVSYVFYLCYLYYFVAILVACMFY